MDVFTCGPDGLLADDYHPIVIPPQTSIEGALLLIRSRLGEELLPDN
jgi:hypothetical protein